MELNGVEWSGVEWSGVGWSGVEWRGVEWSGVAWSGVEWRGVAWRGVVWYWVQSIQNVHIQLSQAPTNGSNRPRHSPVCKIVLVFLAIGFTLGSASERYNG